MLFSTLSYRWEEWGRDQGAIPWRAVLRDSGPWPQIQRTEGRGGGQGGGGQPPFQGDPSEPARRGRTCPPWGETSESMLVCDRCNVQTLQSNLKWKKKSVCPKLHSSKHPAECAYLCDKGRRLEGSELQAKTAPNWKRPMSTDGEGSCRCERWSQGWGWCQVR